MAALLHTAEYAACRGRRQIPDGASIVSMWVFRITFNRLLGVGLGLGIFGIWVTMTID